MYKIGIIGLGLMGGSLSKAFSKLEEVEKIVAYDQNEEALEKGLLEKIKAIPLEIDLDRHDFSVGVVVAKKHMNILKQQKIIGTALFLKIRLIM